MDCKKTIQISTAAKKGDLRKLQALIGSNQKEEVKALVDSKPVGATPLVLAAVNGHIDTVRFLVESCDADVESTGTVTDNGVAIEGAPPLWCAAAVGRLDIVKYLVEKSANVNGTTLTNSTPLRAACFDGYVDVVKYLVENNADIELVNKWGNTCLMISSHKGHTDVVRYLLSMGADVNKKCESDFHVLSEVFLSDKGILLSIGVLYPRQETERLWRCFSSVKLHREKILCVDLTNDYGSAYLMKSCSQGHTDLVRYLLSMRADLNRKDMRGNTALHRCAESKTDRQTGNKEIMEMLVQHGTKMKNESLIEITNESGKTCLMICRYEGHTDVVRYLLSMGVDANKKDMEGKQEIMELLLQHEAILQEDNERVTPLLAAANTGDVHLVEYLIKSGKITEDVHIKALEIMGAALYDEKGDIPGALEYWEKALLRRSCQQNSTTKPDVCSWVATYTGAKELETFEELNELKSDPDPDPVKMRMQCLLVRERILGPTHYNTINDTNFLAVMYANYKKDFKRCIELWMYALDTQMNKQESLSLTTQFYLHQFSYVYNTLMNNNNLRAIKLTRVEIYEVFSKAMTELDRGREVLMAKPNPSMQDKDDFSRLIKTLLHLLSTICRLCDFSTPSSQEHDKFKKLVKKLIKMDPKTINNQSLLHLAVQESTTHAHEGEHSGSIFPCIRCVELLIDLGMPLNNVDADGKTAYDLAFGDYSVNY